MAQCFFTFVDKGVFQWKHVLKNGAAILKGWFSGARYVVSFSAGV